MNTLRQSVATGFLMAIVMVQLCIGKAARADSVQYAVTYQAILDQKATYEDIVPALRTTNTNHLSNLVTALIRVDDIPQVRTLLNDLWTGNESAYPRLPWHLIRTPAVRVAIASSLHAILEPEVSPYLAYIRQQLRSDEPEANRAAARHIGARGDDSDVPALVALIHDRDAFVASTAAAGLSYLDRPTSVAALRELLNSGALSNEKKEAVRQALENLENRPKRFRRA